MYRVDILVGDERDCSMFFTFLDEAVKEMKEKMMQAKFPVNDTHSRIFRKATESPFLGKWVKQALYEKLNTGVWEYESTASFL